MTSVISSIPSNVCLKLKHDQCDIKHTFEGMFKVGIGPVRYREELNIPSKVCLRLELRAV